MATPRPAHRASRCRCARHRWPARRRRRRRAARRHGRGRRPWRPRPARGRARRSSRRRSRCRAGRARRQCDEVVGGGVGVADDHPAHRRGDEVREVGDDHLAGQLADRELLGDPVADPALLDRDQGRRVPLQDRLDGRRRVEGLLHHHLERRVAEDDGAVAGHDPQRLGVVEVEVEEVGDRRHAVRRSAAGQHDVAAGVTRPAYGVADRGRDLLVGRARRPRPTSAASRRCRARPGAGPRPQPCTGLRTSRPPM